jgi:hypothetical protein
LSAPFPMCRTATLAVALAAFAVASAQAAPPTPAAAHRRVTSAHATRHASPTAVHHPVGAHSTPGTVHRPTPEEVGRAAGLRIRGQMARQAATTHHAAPAYRSPHEPGLRRARFSHPYRSAHFEARAYQPGAGRAQVEEASTAGAILPATAAPEPVGEPLTAAVLGTGRTIATAPVSGAYPENQSSAIGRPASEPAQVPAIGTPAAAGRPYESSEEPELTQPADDRADSDAEVATLSIPHGAMPAPLRGSLESLERQNQRLADEGLERIENEDDLAARIANGLLVPVPASEALVVNPSLTANHRYCRPWTARFLADLAREHDAVFHRPIEVSSAVRTVEYQKHLMNVNGNAAPADGDVVSPHLTGATIDIAKGGLNREEMAWMRQRLLALQTAGKIDVEEEFQQACFHITVYKSYAPPHIMRRTAPLRPSRPKAQPDDDNDSPAETPAQGL